MFKQQRPLSGRSAASDRLHSSSLKLTPPRGKRQSKSSSSLSSDHASTSLVDLMLSAVRNGDVVELEKCVKRGCDMNAYLSVRDGFTALHQACQSGSLECVQWLVWHKADMMARSKRGWTPLHIAAIRGQDKCLQALLASNADISVKDPRGRSAAYLAAAHGNSYTLQSLLRAGADLNAADYLGWTPAHAAAYHGRTGALKALLQWGAQLHDVDSCGNTAAHLAASEGHLYCLRFIVCAAQGNVVKVIGAKNDEGDSPLNVSEHFHRGDCAEYLRAIEWDLEHGGDDKGTVYPAHMAAYQGDLQVLQSLVSRGIAGVNDRDDTNCTPAHKAAGNGHVECVRWLMEMGADMSLLNAAGETPRDVARRYGQLGCASLLGSEPDEEPSEDAQMECDEQSQERALHRLEELTKLLEMAKTNYHQLGGLLEDEKRQKEQDTESARIIDDLTSQLQLERVRREKLEAQVDELKGELYSTRLTESSRTSLPLIHSRTTSAPRSAHSKQHQEEKPRGKKSVKGVTRQRLSAEPGVFLIRSSLSPETAVSRRQY